jgi:hypothetical protein
MMEVTNKNTVEPGGDINFGQRVNELISMAVDHNEGNLFSEIHRNDFHN